MTVIMVLNWMMNNKKRKLMLKVLMMTMDILRINMMMNI